MEEIAEAVRKLHNNHSGGPSGIRGEHLKGWLAKAKLEGSGSGNYRGIGLVEVIWKLIAIIINARLLKVTINFHDTLHLHGFRDRRGTRTATIKAKLYQQMATMQQVPLFQIYLDVCKVYNAFLDREGCLEIMEAYGTGKRVVRLLKA
eukprot:scaffold88940_cov68-Attheya_sp.AAC.2